MGRKALGFDLVKWCTVKFPLPTHVNMPMYPGKTPINESDISPVFCHPISQICGLANIIM